jgi:pyroglutamyl-peptidase
MVRSRKRRVPAALVTGFEPFGTHPRNPSGEIARDLDGTTVAGVPVVGRILPVDIAGIDDAIAQTLADVDPVCIINLGLAVGEPVIRLERVALNLAAFELADNAGHMVEGRALEVGADAAVWSRLDLVRIHKALLAEGIPARLSSTAGTYLCNAAMYRFLLATPARIPCGLVHLPLLPAQVAATLARGRGVELGRIASMEPSLMRRAVVLALTLTLAAGSRRRRTRA